MLLLGYLEQFEQNMKEISLGFSVEFDHYLDFDDSDGLILQYFIGEAQAEDPVEINLSFEEMVSEVIDEAKDELDYQFLYSIAHELSRHAEKVRSEAQIMEGDPATIGDYFGIEPGDL